MGDATAQAVRVLSVAQAVDEGSQLTHVVHFSSHHHLLVDDVGLRQVRSLLQGRGVGMKNSNKLTRYCVPAECERDDVRMKLRWFEIKMLFTHHAHQLIKLDDCW